MPQYAVVVSTADSAHAPDATPDELAEPNEHGGVEVRPIHSGGVVG